MIEEGAIFWIDNFPPLDGLISARRPVVVIDCADEDPVVVVGITTRMDDPDAIPLPDTVSEPGSSTGLAQRSFAVPRWIVQVGRSHFRSENHCGRLPSVTLSRLAAAVDAVLAQWPPPKLPPADLP